MTKIGVIVPTGEKAEVEIVRFFDTYGKKYLVYTLNEKDEQGFVKLYVARIDEASDPTGTQKVLTGSFIDDDNEWKVVKDEFKKIIGENSDGGTTTANDQDPAALANVNIKGNRVIKLMESYVKLLSANQKEFAAPAAPAGPAPVIPEAPAFDIPAPSAPEMPQATPFPEMPAYTAPATPVDPIPAVPVEATPVVPETPVAPAPDFGYPAPEAAPSFPEPTSPFPEMPAYTAPAPAAPAATGNYEQMYNELKEKFDRCNAELEKVTNENIELRIKIDDIREILNEN